MCDYVIFYFVSIYVVVQNVCCSNVEIFAIGDI